MLTNIAMTVLSRLAASFVRAMTAAILVMLVAVLLPTREAEAQTTLTLANAGNAKAAATGYAPPK